jgi:hypothetical protein
LNGQAGDALRLYGGPLVDFDLVKRPRKDVNALTSFSSLRSSPALHRSERLAEAPARARAQRKDFVRTCRGPGTTSEAKDLLDLAS